MKGKILSICLGKMHVFANLFDEIFLPYDLVPRLKLIKFKPYYDESPRARLAFYWMWFEADWYFRPWYMWDIRIYKYGRQ